MLFIKSKIQFFESKSQHALGYGFSYEDFSWCLRVEPARWFYKSDILMSITAPKEIIRTFVPENVTTRMKIGYKKYETANETGTINTIHSFREYTSKLKVIDKSVEQLSDFIADTFKIEFQRRLSLDKLTEQGSEDNSLFVLQLMVGKETGNYYIYSAGMNDLFDSGTFNIGISPIRNAQRWCDKLLFAGKETMCFVNGVENYTASSNNSDSDFDEVYYTLKDKKWLEEINENDDVSIPTPHIQPEIIQFEYPLSYREFEQLKLNPYGIIQVNNADYYIKDISLQLLNGIGEFTLIPKV